MYTDLQLIALVEKHAIIYDSRRADYRRKDLQENVWNSIAGILDADVTQVQSRWKYIRQRYSKEKSKCVASGSGGDVEYWDLLKYLGFLAPVVKQRKTLSNLQITSIRDPLSPDPPSDAAESASIWDAVSIISGTTTPSTPVDIEEFILSPEVEHKPSTSAGGYLEVRVDEPQISSEPEPALSTTPKASQSQQPATRKRKRAADVESLEGTLQNISGVFDKLAASNVEPMFDNFGKFVATTLQSMPKEKAQQKIIKLTQVLFDE